MEVGREKGMIVTKVEWKDGKIEDAKQAEADSATGSAKRWNGYVSTVSNRADDITCVSWRTLQVRRFKG